MEKISLIGTGNVAWHLAQALELAGHQLLEVFGRSPKQAHALIENLYIAEYQDHLDFSESEATWFILAVSDDAIADCCEELILPEGAILLHTSGTVPLDVLYASSADEVGILYPLQSFTKGRSVDFGQVPILVEADNPQVLRRLKRLAGSLSEHVQVLGSKERRVVHVAAVFVSNFTNHLLTMASTVLGEEELELGLLQPLVEETVAKAFQLGPQQAQTGPAQRGDEETLLRQQSFLAERHPDMLELYAAFSARIQAYAPDKK
ncbi:Rossmann-like and DUF2520 domain-containing protein [Nitritalea halalkaliphila]|nr:Rossmann-like and DUF2520 domain-containing protein [Nitritalea halalkaliphila]